MYFNSISISWLATLSLLLHFHHSFSAHTNETDRLALLAIKSQLHDPLGVTKSWINSINLCQWTGVTCGHRHQRVTKLDLSNQSIGGTLSPYVANLSFLRSISLVGNNFYGEIPHEIGRLSSLDTLKLSNNSFSGKIPANLTRCSNLTYFYAHTNNLVGEIPVEFGYWLKLEELNIGNNDLTGHLPPSIGNLSALWLIDIMGNRFSGTIPDTLGQLRNLVLMVVGQNQFSGLIPPSIYNISSLKLIYLAENIFSGNLPLGIGINLPNLRHFAISNNNFSGILPGSLSNASSLAILELAQNQFKGKVSIDFSSLKNLSFLNLEDNYFGTGTANDLHFITILTNCSNLKELSLAGNLFGGVLPHSISNLSTTMTAIVMGSNQISGTIPPGIRNLVHLNWFSMERNQLGGLIPHEIGELKNLQLLYLNENLLRGSIPSSLGNLTLLTTLGLGLNNLQGNIPSSLGNCQNLIKLSVSTNKLTGNLPPQILSIATLALYLDLSNNFFNDSLPLEVGNLNNLILLDLSGNQFSGEIPATLSACTSLQQLYMEGNSFKGIIPLSLGSLKSIKELDLSCNNLSGQIPKFLENLFFLEYLNLSYNHFEGEVPTKGVFSNKTGLSLLQNEKLCGGLDELHLPSCVSKGSRKSSVLHLIKVTIPTIVSCLILFACIVIFYARRRGSRHNQSSEMCPMQQHFPMVSYAELSRATDEFSSSNIIGQGSFGLVYKGILGENRMSVAIKVLNLMRKGAFKSFIAECEVLRNIRHRNLIKLITICSSIDFKGVDFKALIYEYMQNRSLEEWLHQSNNQHELNDLSLNHRINIAIDVASAIEYLHHHCQPAIVHGDLKPSNVLLDHDMIAHVGDFGLAKFIFVSQLDNDGKTVSSSIGTKGTVGYIAPEYGTGCEASMTGDVYSFGILLLEMFTGRRPTENMFIEGLTLHEFCKMAIPEKVMEIVDHSLVLEVRSRGDGGVRYEECLVAAIKIGIICSMESPIERMEMRDVVANLCHARDNFLSTRI